jgi:dihydrofolate reductase
MGAVRVFCATSLDGFLAGPGDDLSFLPAPGGPDEDDAGYGAFMAGVGVILMGRRTYDVVRAFPGGWPYAVPVRVATHRPLGAPPEGADVRAVAGDIQALLAEARRVAGAGDVYLDGGELIRQAVDADLVDSVVLTLVPVTLGAGIPLFAGTAGPRRWTRTATRALPHGMVQLTLVREGA